MRPSSEHTSSPIALGLLAGVIWIVWQAIRLPVLALLTTLEPIVSTVLVAAALLGTLTALFWKLTANRPDFPFFGVLGLSLGCFLLVSLYHGLIYFLSGVTNRR